MTLESLGWNDHFAQAFTPYEELGLVPARVAVQHRGGYVVLTEDGELEAEAARRQVRRGELAGVGDWVALRILTDGQAIVEAVLPRRTAFTRKETMDRIGEQIVAANVDTVFLVSALGHDLNLRRPSATSPPRGTAARSPSSSSPRPTSIRTRCRRRSPTSRRSRSASRSTRSRTSPARASTRSSRTSGRGGRSRCWAPQAWASRRSSTGSSARSGCRRRRCARTTSAAGTRRPTASSCRCPAAPCSSTLPECASSSSMRTRRRWTPPSRTSPSWPRSAASPIARTSTSRAAPFSPRSRRAGSSPERWQSYRKLQAEIRALEIRQDKRLQSGGAEAVAAVLQEHAQGPVLGCPT